MSATAVGAPLLTPPGSVVFLLMRAWPPPQLNVAHQRPHARESRHATETSSRGFAACALLGRVFCVPFHCEPDLAVAPRPVFLRAFAMSSLTSLSHPCLRKPRISVAYLFHSVREVSSCEISTSCGMALLA